MQFFGYIAQLVEQRPFKPMVGGSNPSVPTDDKIKHPWVFYFFKCKGTEGFERAEASAECRRGKRA